MEESIVFEFHIRKSLWAVAELVAKEVLLEYLLTYRNVVESEFSSGGR